jgi:hypothetical protein
MLRFSALFFSEKRVCKRKKEKRNQIHFVVLPTPQHDSCEAEKA